MGAYDLYGQYYPSRRDAENAEMAQCAAIDANLAYQQQQKLEQEMYNNQQREYYWQQEIEMRLRYLEQPLRIIADAIHQQESNK